MTPKSVQVGALDLQMEKGNWGRVVGLVSGFTVYEPGAKGEQCIVVPSSSTGTYYVALAHKDLWPETLDVVVPV